MLSPLYRRVTALLGVASLTTPSWKWGTPLNSGLPFRGEGGREAQEAVAGPGGLASSRRQTGSSSRADRRQVGFSHPSNLGGPLSTTEDPLRKTGVTVAIRGGSGLGGLLERSDCLGPGARGRFPVCTPGRGHSSPTHTCCLWARGRPPSCLRSRGSVLSSGRASLLPVSTEPGAGWRAPTRGSAERSQGRRRRLPAALRRAPSSSASGVPPPPSGSLGMWS